MQEIKCPKCGEYFTIDESGYASIVKQVRDHEFSKDIEERKAQMVSNLMVVLCSNKDAQPIVNSGSIYG